MTKTTVLAAVLFASLIPATALAQSGPLLGVDAQVALPLGNFGDAVGVGFGGLLRYEVTVAGATNVTVRAGFIYHLTKEISPGFDSKFWTIPLLGGLKVPVGEHLYVAGEAGLFINHASANTPLGSASNTESDFGLTLGGGYRLGAVDFRLGLHILDLGHAGDSIEVAANLGYNF